MISAKDEFFLEREMIAELQQMIYSSDLSQEERVTVYQRLESEISAEEFEEIRSKILQRQPNPLTRIRNGETLSAKQIKEAVRRAADTE